MKDHLSFPFLNYMDTVGLVSALTELSRSQRNVPRQ
jgi:hypothetical protein